MLSSLASKEVRFTFENRFTCGSEARNRVAYQLRAEPELYSCFRLNKEQTMDIGMGGGRMDSIITLGKGNLETCKWSVAIVLYETIKKTTKR